VNAWNAAGIPAAQIAPFISVLGCLKIYNNLFFNTFHRIRIENDGLEVVI